MYEGTLRGAFFHAFAPYVTTLWPSRAPHLRAISRTHVALVRYVREIPRIWGTGLGLADLLAYSLALKNALWAFFKFATLFEPSTSFFLVYSLYSAKVSSIIRKPLR